MPILLPEQTDVVAFGDFLRHAREQRGLTLQQIARETRIPWRHLDALEHGNLAAVPSGMYRRAEIRAYADAVGLDKGVALAQLEHALEVAEPHARETRSRPLSRYAISGVRIVGAIGLATIATLAVLAWWATGGDGAARGAEAPPLQVAETRGAEAPPPHVAETRGTEAPQPRVAETRGADATPPAVAEIREAPATPPLAAVPVDVGLVVTTDPAGARVMVDGIGWGVSPLTIRHLAPGVRRVRVVKDGFVSEERSVRVAAGREPAAVTIPMRPVGTP
jgi:cytoskeletal protein RodZ